MKRTQRTTSIARSAIGRVAATATMTLTLLAAARTASADITFEWVHVVDEGNAADSTGFGAVPYRYRIAKYEVTNDQYARFLDAVADSDPNQLWNPNMEIDRFGSDGSYIYGPPFADGDRPVHHVSFLNAMRFANWLHNGQPIGPQGPGTTEDGAYTIGNGLNETRSAGARFFIPSEDEWYKAAYYDPRPSAEGGPPGDDNYWSYPTRSDVAPTGTAPPGDVNSCNFDDAVGMTTDIGSYVSSLSFYNTFDQAGNLNEFTEAIIGGAFRGMRGGSYADTLPDVLGALFQDSILPDEESAVTGFRIAAAPGMEAIINCSGPYQGGDPVPFTVTLTNHRPVPFTSGVLIRLRFPGFPAESMILFEERLTFQPGQSITQAANLPTSTETVQGGYSLSIGATDPILGERGVSSFCNFNIVQVDRYPEKRQDRGDVAHFGASGSATKSGGWPNHRRTN